MTIKNSHRHDRDAKAQQPPSADLQSASEPERITIDVECSGEWLPAEDLRDASLSALDAGSEVTVNLNGIDHLDASSLQILLALAAGKDEQGQPLRLENSSPQLRQWFAYAGAAEKFPASELKCDE